MRRLSHRIEKEVNNQSNTQKSLQFLATTPMQDNKVPTPMPHNKVQYAFKTPMSPLAEREDVLKAKEYFNHKDKNTNSEKYKYGNPNGLKQSNTLNDPTNTTKRHYPSIFRSPFAKNVGHPLWAENKAHMYIGPNHPPGTKAMDLFEHSQEAVDLKPQKTNQEKTPPAVDCNQQQEQPVDLENKPLGGSFTPGILTSNGNPKDDLVTEVSVLNENNKVDGSKGTQYVAYKDSVHFSEEEHNAATLVRELNEKEAEKYREAMSKPGRIKVNFPDLKRYDDFDKNE